MSHEGCKYDENLNIITVFLFLRDSSPTADAALVRIQSSQNLDLEIYITDHIQLNFHSIRCVVAGADLL